MKTNFADFMPDGMSVEELDEFNAEAAQYDETYNTNAHKCVAPIERAQAIREFFGELSDQLPDIDAAWGQVTTYARYKAQAMHVRMGDADDAIREALRHEHNCEVVYRDMFDILRW